MLKGENAHFICTICPNNIPYLLLINITDHPFVVPLIANILWLALHNLPVISAGLFRNPFPIREGTIGVLIKQRVYTEISMKHTINTCNLAK